LRSSNPETFPVSVSIGELDTGSLQSRFDGFYGLIGNDSPLFFKIDDRRQAQLRSTREL
jgi:hypothetical protein